MINHTCCFFGHRNIVETNYLNRKLKDEIKKLIVEENITTFLFGDRSQFNDLCYNTVSELKHQFPAIKRIYVRARFPYINEDYTSYLLESYEETYFPEHILNSGKLCYIERNYEMIDNSRFCIIYFDENNIPLLKPTRQSKSGTMIAYEYAKKKNKQIINLLSK